MCLRYFVKSPQDWTAEENSETPCHQDCLNKTSQLVNHFCNAEYAIAVIKYLKGEMLSNKCVLKSGARGVVMDVQNGSKDLADLPQKLFTKVRTVLTSVEKSERVKDALYTRE